MDMTLLVIPVLLMVNFVLGLICHIKIIKYQRLLEHIHRKLSRCDGLMPHDREVIKEVLISIENMEALP